VLVYLALRGENSGALPLVPREKIDDVRDRTNIVDVIKRYVELKRAGTGSWKGLCPFHTEKTPSFHVHEARQFFHCFGCGEKGDVFAFLGKIEQRSFSEVLRDLAEQAGVELPERAPLSPAERRARVEAESERDRLLRVSDQAATFFEQALISPAGEAARAYLAKRQIGPETQRRFRVGYAPAGWKALQEALARKGIGELDTERLGLVGVNERGRYDFFRDRVMLPVFDRQKRVIGFGSRLLDPDAKDRKYVNSPDSPLFHKKECLYGLHAALDAIRKSGTAVVVEGNFDVMALHEAGIQEAVAPMGTALTSEQVALLGKLARRVVVVFDGDQAGKRAAEKAVPLFVDADLDGRVARLPAGQDPDDFVREHGAPAFRKLIEAGRPMLDQFIQDAAQETSVPGRIAALEAVAAMLVRVKDPTTQELYAKQTEVVLGLNRAQVSRALRDAREQAAAARARAQAVRAGGMGAPEGVHDSFAASGSGARAAPGAGPGVVPREHPLAPERTLPRDELELLALLATYPDLASAPEAERAGELLVDPGARNLFRTARAELLERGRLDVPAWLEAGPPDVRRSVMAALMDEGVSRAENPSAKLRALGARLELQRVEAEISMTLRMLGEARSRGDVSATQAMIVRGIELDKTKQGLKAALQRP
ncbi:MAG TPA: DNA primase, partial [Polyangia bacterium]